MVEKTSVLAEGVLVQRRMGREKSWGWGGEFIYLEMGGALAAEISQRRLIEVKFKVDGTTGTSLLTAADTIVDVSTESTRRLGIEARQDRIRIVPEGWRPEHLAEVTTGRVAAKRLFAL